METRNSEFHTVRLLIDQGSELSFISEELVRRTKRLKRSAALIPLLGIGGVYSGRTKGIVSMRLCSIHDPTSHCVIEACILPRLTTKLPAYDSSLHSWPHINGLQLADLDFANSGFIHIIGSDNYDSVILPGLIRGGTASPLAQRTIFG